MASELVILSEPPSDVKEELEGLKMQLDLEIPAKSLDSNLLIATWNIRSLSNLTRKWEAGENDSPKRDLKALRAIAEIVHRFDVVAIQEVRSHLHALRELVKALGPHWSYVLTDVTKGDRGNLERMAFLFDTRKLRMSGLACELVVPPDNVSIDPDALKNQFARTPYAVSFETINSPLKKTTSFILVTLHIYYGKRAGDRVPELKAIAEWMADWAKSEYAYDSNLIALGDFNIDRENDPLHKAFTSTGLKAPTELNKVPRTIFSSSEKDHFYDQIAWFSGDNSIPPLNIRYSKAGGFDFTKSLYANTDLTKTQKSWKISDHYPLWAEFDIT
jgi:endonuclease/exonuclease/phosphatase family metal-dependent hydrolase